MMLVETFVGPSAIEGVGVFAVDWIRKGDKIWVFDDSFDRLIPESGFTQLPTEVRRFVERYAYRSPEFPGFLVLEMDNARFMNHSDRPNTNFVNPILGFATRDIAPGAELTCNYHQLEPGFVLLPSVHMPANGNVRALANGSVRTMAKARKISAAT